MLSIQYLYGLPKRRKPVVTIFCMFEDVIWKKQYYNLLSGIEVPARRIQFNGFMNAETFLYFYITMNH